MAKEILVSAASSLTDAFKELGAAFPGGKVTFNFAASGPLSQQILAGAPVDVFAAASAKEMDQLEKAGRLVKGTRRDFVSNRLVLIVPVGGKVKTWDDLRGAGVKRIALSNPDSVPSGRYARETLQKRGVWVAVQSKAVLGENVRQTLAYVASGDVDAGLVFATDARIEAKKVRIVATAIPEKDHAAIHYPVAVIAGGPNPTDARRFVQYLGEAPAQRILARYGFLPPAKTPPGQR
jgi:molybdate transport system substrate-binding protein